MITAAMNSSGIRSWNNLAGLSTDVPATCLPAGRLSAAASVQKSSETTDFLRPLGSADATPIVPEDVSIESGACVQP
jgi:hypothetical protein